MAKSQNPLREIASPVKFSVEGGTGNLVANGVYSVEDIVLPLSTYDSTIGDPRLFVTQGQRRSKVRLRKVNQAGWISPKKIAKDDKDTVLQIKWAKPKKFNFLSFELLRVPQQWSVKYYDSVRKQMVPLTDLTGNKVGGSLSGFRVNTSTPGQDKDEPKKWRTFTYALPNIRSNLIELHLNREVNNPPIDNLDDFFGFPKDTPYSLGVRNLKIKMRIRDDGDDDDGGGDGNPGPPGITERAVIKRHTSINAHDGGESTYWECAPQGAATSVVPFYLDLTQDDGTESVFDMLKLVPLWPGPSMSVYFSSDDTTLPWTLSPNRVNLAGLGDITPTQTQDSGIEITNSNSSYMIDNAYLRMDTSKDFVSGLNFTPTTTNTGNDRWLWNFEDGAGKELGLKFDPTSQTASTVTGEFKVVQDSSNVLATFSTSYTLNINTTYGVVVGYNHSDYDPAFPRGWYLSVSTSPGTSSTVTRQFVQGTVPGAFFPVRLRIGSNSATNRPTLGFLSHLWFKLDSYTDRTAQYFLFAPDPFIAGDGDPEQRTNGFYNGILAAKLTEDIEVRVGPGAGYFRNKQWTPVPIDYSLSTTQYHLPVIKAKYLKLEFSNLQVRTYLTDVDELPVTDFPSWVKDWFNSIPRQNQGVPYTSINVGRSQFEGIPPIRTPGDHRKFPTVRETLESGGGRGLPVTTYHRDQANVEAVANPQLFDQVGLYKEIQNATVPFKFLQTARHDYVTHFVPVEDRAFFVGLKELQVFRSDHTVMMDTPEYDETYDDATYISSSTGWINVGGSMQAQDVSKVITSKTFESFSKFSTIQAAVLDSGWESVMTQDQIELGTVTHLVDPTNVDLASSTSTLRTYVTGQYQGARGGNVLQFTRASGGTGDYGVRFKEGVFSGSAITGSGPRTSVVVRMQLPTTNRGSYELRLYAFDSGVTQTFRLVAKKPIRIPIKSWQEIELAYIANEGDQDWRAEVVQTDTSVTEPFLVDMLGVWQNPIKWEFSNDGGSTYQVALWPLNKPTGYIRFLTAGNQLVVRTTSLKDNAVVSGWTVVPWYIESPMVVRAPIDLNPPWNISDSEALRDTSHKPIFNLWNHWFPQGFSINLRGYF